MDAAAVTGALADRCLVCPPSYFGAPVLAMIRDGRVRFLGYDYSQAAYEIWYQRYGLCPRDLELLHDAGKLGSTPPYHQRGEL